MPELTVRRKNAAPPPMICMYCGRPATLAREWREENHKPVRGGDGGDPMPVPTGDDPVSAAIAILLLPFALWQLLTGLAAAVGAVVGFINRPAPPVSPAPASPPKPLPTTLVVVTTCDRHRRFRARFAWAGAGALALLAALWTWAVLETRRVMGTEAVGLALTLILTAIAATVLLPTGLSVWYVFRGPVIVERVTEDSVVLDRVRQQYFDAAGIKPTDATCPPFSGCNGYDRPSSKRGQR
jgi:hypothetical protein